MTGSNRKQSIFLVIEASFDDSDRADGIRDRYDLGLYEGWGNPGKVLTLRLDGDGVSLLLDGQVLRGDFSRMLPRIHPHRIFGELLVKAARIKGVEGPLTAIDATAGLGEDALLLAAAGFEVTLYERNPIIFELLEDALRRAGDHPELGEAISRMKAFNGDSLEALKALDRAPDVILLDPMFPERTKSALVKKKLQVIQGLEQPCEDEALFLKTAMEAGSQKLIVKRPPKGAPLAGVKPDYSLKGKAVRYDCFVQPLERLIKFTF